MSNQLVPFRTTGALNFTLLSEAETLRDSIIAKSKAFAVVNDEASKNKAVEDIAQLKGLVADCEICRVSEKKPAKDYGEMIDIKAKEFKLPAELEIARREGLIGVYVTEQQRKAKEQADRLRAEAQAKLDAEKKAAEELAAAQERARNATNAEERLKAAQEAKRLADEALQREMDAAEAPAPAAPDFINTKVTGAAVKRTPNIFVHDVHELYKAHPECVTLKENIPAIKNIIKLQESKNQPINIPGVDVSFTTDIQVKKSTSGLNLLH